MIDDEDEDPVTLKQRQQVLIVRLRFQLRRGDE